MYVKPKCTLFRVSFYRSLSVLNSEQRILKFSASTLPVQFSYTDQVELDGTNWMRLLEVAHYFLVKPLVNLCVEIGFRDTSSHISKALEGFQTLRLYDYKEMMDQIGQFMAE